jgi:hypothetical protein
LILIGYAVRRQQVTYGDLARTLNFAGAGVVGWPPDLSAARLHAGGVTPRSCGKQEELLCYG